MVTKKKSPAKKPVKKKIKSSATTKPKKLRKPKKEPGADVIFDSEVGNTDALFVANPEPIIPENSNNLQPSDAAVEEALKDMGGIENVEPQKTVEPTPHFSPKTESFWQKIKSIFKKN